MRSRPFSSSSTQPGETRAILAPLPFGLIAGALVLRNKRIWQWGRLLAPFGGLMGLLVWVILMFGTTTRPSVLRNSEDLPYAAVMFLGSVMLLGMFVSLGTRSARHYFRLLCPLCHQATGRATDYRFNESRCRSCGHVWSTYDNW